MGRERDKQLTEDRQEKVIAMNKAKIHDTLGRQYNKTYHGVNNT